MSKIFKARIVRECVLVGCCICMVFGFFTFGPSYMFSQTSDTAQATVLGVCSSEFVGKINSNGQKVLVVGETEIGNADVCFSTLAEAKANGFEQFDLTEN